MSRHQACRARFFYILKCHVGFFKMVNTFIMKSATTLSKIASTYTTLSRSPPPPTHTHTFPFQLFLTQHHRRKIRSVSNRFTKFRSNLHFPEPGSSPSPSFTEPSVCAFGLFVAKVKLITNWGRGTISPKIGNKVALIRVVSPLLT